MIAASNLSRIVRDADTLITARLERWAGERPDSRALVFLGDGEREDGALTFADLHRAALTLAGSLQPHGVAGRPVLILTRSALEFAVAFFGCLYAGAIAVPCSTGPRNRGWERIAAIAADAQPAAALCADGTADLTEAAAELGIPTIPILAEPAGFAGSFMRTGLPDAPALLQYTSGSTGSPKGVVITHRNLACNLQMLQACFGIQEQSVYLTWLPLFHDMGLIGNFLAAIYCGVPCILMPPLSFYQRPQRWLAAVSRYGATISGGPNFGYDLCIRRFGRMDLTGIDLSSWELAFCGAELVRPTTMRRFAERFACVGFRSSALYPCYGLAEATVFVSGGVRNGGFNVARNQAGAEAVSCGRAAPGSCIAIVDPDVLQVQPEGNVGEIWVGGDHVADGYWNKPYLRERVFAARLPGVEQPFLQTGDLGWVRNGDLYLAGRLKDLIVYRGTKFHPEDLEATATECSAAFSDINAAFSIEIGIEEHVVIIQELARSVPQDFDPSVALKRLAEAIADVHGLRLHHAVLVRSGTVPRTTSGKVQRIACRDLYLEGRLSGA